MPVIAKVLISGTTLPTSLGTAPYTATGVTTIIDKFTATNYSGGAVTVTVYLSGTGSDSLIVKSHSLASNETYTFPEITGHILAASGYIQAIASAGSSVTIRASGREIS